MPEEIICYKCNSCGKLSPITKRMFLVVSAEVRYIDEVEPLLIQDKAYCDVSCFILNIDRTLQHRPKKRAIPPAFIPPTSKEEEEEKM